MLFMGYISKINRFFDRGDGAQLPFTPQGGGVKMTKPKDKQKKEKKEKKGTRNKEKSRLREEAKKTPAQLMREE